MSKRSVIEISLVPAARSEWDESGRLQGGSDLPARAASLDAMKSLLEAADTLAPGVILSAPDEASRATARLLSDLAGGKVKPLESLSDPSLGLWEGLQESAAMERYASAFKQWRNDPASVIPPEGESFEDAVERIVGGVMRAIEKSSKSAIAIVARPAAYQILQRWMLGKPIAEEWRTSGSDIVYTMSLPRTRLPEAILKASATAK